MASVGFTTMGASNFMFSDISGGGPTSLWEEGHLNIIKFQHDAAKAFYRLKPRVHFAHPFP